MILSVPESHDCFLDYLFIKSVLGIFLLILMSDCESDCNSEWDLLLSVLFLLILRLLFS